MSGASDPLSLGELYREQYGRIVGALVRRLGARRLELAESAAQQAFTQALISWRPGATPDNPGAWLMRCAHNHAIDHLRREARSREIADAERGPALTLGSSATPQDPRFDGELVDDSVRLLFLCAHPDLSPAEQLVLMLRIACGFTTQDTSRALLLSDNALYQRTFRARRHLRRSGASFEVPGPDELGERLHIVLSAVYLLFGCGYSPSDRPEVFVPSLVLEADRLLNLLTAHPATNTPSVHALHALVLLNGSRLASRQRAGELVPLAQQDRRLWDQDRIERGMTALARAGRGDERSEYHLLAGIAACHAVSRSPHDTDWPRILSLYDALCASGDSFVHRVNRAVAVSEVHGASAGLRALEQITSRRAQTFYLLHAARAHLLSALDHAPSAREAWLEAARLAPTPSERRHCERRAQRG